MWPNLARFFSSPSPTSALFINSLVAIFDVIFYLGCFIATSTNINYINLAASTRCGIIIIRPSLDRPNANHLQIGQMLIKSDHSPDRSDPTKSKFESDHLPIDQTLTKSNHISLDWPNADQIR